MTKQSDTKGIAYNWMYPEINIPNISLFLLEWVTFLDEAWLYYLTFQESQLKEI